MKIALVGYGKMGKAIEQILRSRGHDIALIIDKDNTQDLNADNLQGIDVAIEFSTPQTAFHNISICLEAGTPVVCGTTAWLDRFAEVEELCRRKNGTFFYASNYSIGVNIFFEVNRRLAELMNRFAEYDVTIEETHHTQKKDAPSGTAPYIGTYSAIGNYNTNAAIAPNSMQLNNLKWETSTEYNIGTDLGFMDNKMTMTFDYYHKVTDDLLQTKVTIPSTVGYSSGQLAYYNSGKLSNTGWEYRIDYEIFRNKDWTVSAKFNLTRNVNKILDERTDPGWPTTWFAPILTGKGAFTDVYSVMANMGANHGAWTYGHIGADIITLASMLRIPVYAHNVPEDKIYRPAAWNLFGTADPEGADFRACANFGPIYGKY